MSILIVYDSIFGNTAQVALAMAGAVPGSRSVPVRDAATIDLNGNRMDLEDLRVSVKDLERFGPALIVDHQGTDGGRVLVWSQ